MFFKASTLRIFCTNAQVANVRVKLFVIVWLACFIIVPYWWFGLLPTGQKRIFSFLLVWVKWRAKKYYSEHLFYKKNWVFIYIFCYNYIDIFFVWGHSIFSAHPPPKKHYHTVCTFANVNVIIFVLLSLLYFQWFREDIGRRQLANCSMVTCQQECVWVYRHCVAATGIRLVGEL